MNWTKKHYTTVGWFGLEWFRFPYFDCKWDKKTVGTDTWTKKEQTMFGWFGLGWFDLQWFYYSKFGDWTKK